MFLIVDKERRQIVEDWFETREEAEARLVSRIEETRWVELDRVEWSPGQDRTQLRVNLISLATISARTRMFEGCI